MAGIAHVITSDSASGAQIIDGSVGFTSESQTHLTRTPSSEGNRKTFTYSCWVKRDSLGDNPVNNKRLFSAQDTDAGSNSYSSIYFRGTGLTGQIEFLDYLSGTREGRMRTEGRPCRDTSGWYNVCVAVDYTDSTAKDRIKIYINGVRQGRDSTNDIDPDTTDQTFINSTEEHNIGKQPTDTDKTLSGRLSQVYLIDGQALGPEYFGFTDPLTNTWKPKKYVNTTASHGDVGGVVGFGTNGFYLPFDGSAPIGQDQSGQGNNWTPVNFGGSVALDSPLVSGARPILNTTQGGTQAGVGVFGSKQNVGYAVTVYNSGGGNKYYLDGVEAPTLTGLIRGATYTFDQSDSTNSSHPLVFGTTAEGNNFNGASKTGASAGSAGAATTITIPYDGPNTIYYHCSSHSGMGADITGITTNEKLADQYASNCTLALPLVGNSADVSVSVACTSSIKATANSGNAAASSDTSNFYAGSFEFDGTGDYITVTDSSEITLGAGDFTIEYWQNLDSVSGNPTPFDKGYSGSGIDANGWVIQYSSSQKRFYVGSTAVLTDTDTTPTGKWIHWAFVRSSGTLKMYRDGIEKVSASNSTDLSHATNLGIGANLEAGSGFTAGQGAIDGYLSDIRIYKGIAKYTSNFVVPSRSPAILPDTPSGVSGSSKLTKITDGAVYFDGTGDYLRAASVSWNPNTSNFTIECFIYLDTAANEKFIAGALDWFWFSCSYTGGSSGVTSGKFGFSMRNSANDTWYSVSSTTSFTSGRWYHVAATWDGTYQRMFVNGVQERISADRSSIDWASKTTHVDIGGYSANTGFTIDGHISNLRIIDGTALYTKNFTAPPAPLTNVTNTEVLCCQSVGVTTAAAVGIVTAYNDAAATNFNPFITDVNTVRGQESGYATLNPLATPSKLTLSEGNLRVKQTGSDYALSPSTLTVNSGKWYIEVDLVNERFGFGIAELNKSDLNTWIGQTAYDWGWKWDGTSSAVRHDTAGGGTAYASATSAGDVIALAFDLSGTPGTNTGVMTYYKNGVSQGVAFSDIPIAADKFYQIVLGDDTSSQAVDAIINFGQKPFKFPPPDGFQPLNTANVRPVNVISRPDQYVGISTYDGENNTRDIQTGFAPDLVLFKCRNSTKDWAFYDSVRDVENRLRTPIDTEGAEATDSGGLTSFNYDGFTMGNSTFNNGSSKTYVSYSFKAGGNSGTFNIDDVGYATAAAAGLDGGTITPTGASVGTKQGFSIIGYTGTDNASDTFSHGLSQKPDFAIFKNRTDGTDDWIVYHSSEGATKRIKLNLTNAFDAQTSQFNDTEPTSSLFTIGTYDNINKLSKNYISYIWHNVLGLQKFGTYVGNENTGGDGPFVELGFRPAIIWIKNADQGTSAADWVIYDSERNKFNPSGKQLYPNRNIAEADDSNHYFDILSNGFKVRSTATTDLTNATDTYIYCAWAEAPSIDLYGGGANAR